ncbi:hypothetical protein SAMN02927923_02792 [Microvirga guangxiensis]|uniref:Uncharacterized protein n=1 Tax=Microvirga guangxiensis TaxID=549386 RepID=A0A1G5JQJ6_9HYPH|nr:hypothetical protein SAMN02927923_02792 [Microvirga guangxiensis]
MGGKLLEQLSVPAPPLTALHGLKIGRLALNFRFKREERSCAVPEREPQH